MDSAGKKTAVAILEEVTHEVGQWLQVLLNGQRKTGHVDLEASEMMLRSATAGSLENTLRRFVIR